MNIINRTFSIESLRRWLDSYEQDRLRKRNYLYKIKLTLKRLSIWLGFHASLKYFPIVRHIRNSHIENPLILEIGSGPIGITKYLKEKVVGLDINPRQLRLSPLQLIKGSAAFLPFADDAFNFTVSADFFEYILPSERTSVISEMIRVTKKDVIIAVPCGEKAKKREKKVKDIHERKVKLWHKKDLERERFVKQKGAFLAEHEAMGLPDEEDVIESINQSIMHANDNYSVEVKDNESLWVWYWFVLAELRYSYIRWLVTTITAFFLLPLLKRIHWGGCYRKIFVIKNG